MIKELILMEVELFLVRTNAFDQMGLTQIDTFI